MSSDRHPADERSGIFAQVFPIPAVNESAVSAFVSRSTVPRPRGVLAEILRGVLQRCAPARQVNQENS